MSQPPAKRQRTLRSRAEIANDAPTKSPKTKPKAGSKAIASASNVQSPSKRAALSEQRGTKKGALDQFFHPATNDSSYGAVKSTSPVESGEDDAIQDDFSDPDLESLPARRPRTAPKAAQAARGPGFRPALARAGGIVGKGDLQGSSHQEGENAAFASKPWTEAYAPQDASELAVHKKKVVDVRSWLGNVLSGRERKRLLVLEGPSGAGKSTTIQVLSKELDFGVVEWANAAAILVAGTESYAPMVSRFGEFLNRSGSYSSLVIEGGSAETSKEIQLEAVPNHRHKVILVEEFPVTLPFNEDSLRKFQSSILQYLSSDWPHSLLQPGLALGDSTSPTPVVMIVTESRASASASGSDGFTAHRLLGQDLLRHPAVTSIEFNPMAPTLITKALELVARKEARRSGRRRVPGHEVLKALGELGDLRSAIGSLEFLCKKGGKDGDWSGRIAATKGSKAAPTETELDAIRTISLRDSTISLFHAAGKILYNKRIPPSKLPANSAIPTGPPDFLTHHARPNTSEVQVDTLMDETGADTRTFVATLHENFAWSCNGDREVDVLDHCLDILSDSDMMSPDTSGHLDGRARGNTPWLNKDAVDFLLQDEIAFRTAASGLLFSLPYPVKRTTGQQGRGNSGDAFKMFYPTSLRLWKQLEQCKSLIAGYSSRYIFGSTRTAEMTEETIDGGESRSSRLLDELVQERLPYLCKIRQSSGNQLGIADLEAITQLKGTTAGDEDDDNTEESVPYRSSFAKARPWQAEKKRSSELQSAGNVDSLDEIAGKLILSDDDIEDG